MADNLKNADKSHAIAGAAGGTLVLLLAYTWYRMSGTHAVISTATQGIETARSFGRSAKDSTPNPQAVVGYLRQIAKTYTAAIPGLGFVVDSAMDKLESLSEHHGEAVDKFLKETYDEVKDAMSKGGDDMGDRIVKILSRRVGDLQELSRKVGSSIIDPLLDKNPQLKKIAGDSLDQFKQLADQHGPEVRRLYDDAHSQLNDLVKQGLSATSLAEAAHVLRTKLREAQDVAKSSGEQVWQDAAQKAQPVLDKMPDVSKYLSQALEPIKNKVGPEGAKLISQTYDDLERIGKDGMSKDNMQKARKLIEERIKKLKDIVQQQQGSESASGSFGIAGLSLSSIPGLDKLSPDLQGLQQLAEHKAPEAQKLFNDTMKDLQEVLRKRGDEAKKFGGEVTKEVKDNVKQ